MNDQPHFDPVRNGAIRDMLISNAHSASTVGPSVNRKTRRGVAIAGFVVLAGALVVGSVSYVATTGTSSGVPNSVAKGHAVTSWNTNANGQTYGSLGSHPFPPDLVRVHAINHLVGYVYSIALERAKATSDSTTPSNVVLLPVYESDGKTKIGVFKVSNKNSLDQRSDAGGNPTG
jgi:hypothetical protein